MNLIHPNKITLTAVCGIVAGLALSSANAESLLLDFGPTTVATPYLTLSPGHNAGTISGSETSWNKISSSAATSSLLWGNGSAATGLTLSLGQEAVVGNNTLSFSTAISRVDLAGTGGSVAGQKSLLGAGSIYGDDTSSTAVGRDGFFGGGTGAAGAAIGLRLDGLAAGDYFLYVMARNVNSDAASIPMNIYATAAASAGTFDFSALTSHPQANTGFASATYTDEYNSFQNGENFVGLSISVQEGQSLFLAVDGASVGETRGFLNSFEIVQAPEPSAAAFFAMSFGALAWILKKRRVA
ncbi:MAG TPA: hypothetical protein VIV82_01945 [Verrucomicrobiae bacterium]